MRTVEMFDAAEVPRKWRHHFKKMLSSTQDDYGWAGRYFRDDCPGPGYTRDGWADRDVVVMRCLLDCMRDGVEDPTRFALVTAIRHVPEGTEMIRVDHPGIHTFYRPRWSDT